MVIITIILISHLLFKCTVFQEEVYGRWKTSDCEVNDRV